MNGQSTVGHPITNNEQLIGKFHVEKLPNNTITNHDEVAHSVAQQTVPVSSTGAAEESSCASRFQMIRVDRSFARGRWKVNDYEPPENMPTSINPPVNAIETEPIHNSNPSTYVTVLPASSPAATAACIAAQPANMAHLLTNDSNMTSSAALTAAAASAAAAATAFQQQQQRLAMNNPAAVVPTANVPNPNGLLHAFTQATLPNMATANPSFLLSNHPQFTYYPFFPPPYAPYAAQWAALAGANPYLTASPLPPPQQQQPPPTTSQLPPVNLGDPIRHADPGSDINGENSLISSNAVFPNATAEHLQNAQMAAASFLYAAHHPHSNYLSQAASTPNSSYGTIPAYHSAPGPPTILPAMQSLSVVQPSTANANDIQLQAQIQSHQVTSQQPAPAMTSPKHETQSVKNPIPLPSSISNAAKLAVPNKPTTNAPNGNYADTSRTITGNHTPMADLLSSSPSMIHSQQPQASLLSPIAIQTTNSNVTSNTLATSNNNPTLSKAPTTSLNDIWGYTNTGSPLNLSQAAVQTAAVTAVAAMGLLNNESGQNTGIANEIFKELTTPTKQNNATDIDNKISAAMDLVKMHLLSAVSEEVTELRQQIRTLNEKVASVEHENAFLRSHVSNEIYAQYTPMLVGLTGANESTNLIGTISTTTTNVSSVGPSSSVSSSQSIPTVPPSSQPSSLPTASASTTSINMQHPLSVPVSSINQPSN